MIVFEILDKIVDFSIALEYYKGMFDSRKDTVYGVLLAFTIIGSIISVARISLYIWRIFLNCKDDESHEKLYEDLNLLVISLKDVLAGLPKSTTASFYVHCPVKEHSWGV